MSIISLSVVTEHPASSLYFLILRKNNVYSAFHCKKLAVQAGIHPLSNYHYVNYDPTEPMIGKNDRRPSFTSTCRRMRDPRELHHCRFSLQPILSVKVSSQVDFFLEKGE